MLGAGTCTYPLPTSSLTPAAMEYSPYSSSTSTPRSRSALIGEEMDLTCRSSAAAIFFFEIESFSVTSSYIRVCSSVSSTSAINYTSFFIRKSITERCSFDDRFFETFFHGHRLIIERLLIDNQFVDMAYKCCGDRGESGVTYPPVFYTSMRKDARKPYKRRYLCGRSLRNIQRVEAGRSLPWSTLPRNFVIL